MSFTNSPLVSYTKISPNRTNNRNHAIDTITIHCVVGQTSVQTLGAIFARTSAQASSNYGVGYDGKIGMYVEEKDRSWCTSSSSNDNRAITIEVASDTTHPYAVTDAAYKSLINLLVDICQRNNIKELKWKADKSLIGQPDKQNMTVHRWFANKSCPGEYLYSRHGQIASEVNARLNKNGGSEAATPTKPVESKPSNSVTTGSIKAGDKVSINSGATYYNGGEIPSWVSNKQWIVKEVEGARAVIDKSVDGKNSICSPINIKYLTVVGAAAASTSTTASAATSYKVKIDSTCLNIRKGPGTNYDRTGAFTGAGIFTIVETKPGTGSKSGWGKLKSGAGWISLDYTKRV